MGIELPPTAQRPDDMHPDLHFTPIPEPAPIPSAASTLLLVDDDAAIRQMFQRVIALSLPAVKVDVADSGRQGIERFMQRHHAALVLDFQMPGMTGLETFREIERICRARSWDMPRVIFCSGFASSQEIYAIARRDPRHVCLTKPVSFTVFIETVRAFLKL